MVSQTTDHIIAFTVFIAAIVLFIGLFNGTIQTAIVYQNHRTTATKASDMLDMILLSPGSPVGWGMTNTAPSVFGIQDPEFTQYVLNPFSLNRLIPYSPSNVTYGKTLTQTGIYNNLSIGSDGYLLMPYESLISYSTASKLLGVNGSYGFQLTIIPIVSVTISQVQTNPLSFSIKVDGVGASLAGATVNYQLVTVNLSSSYSMPQYSVVSGTAEDKTDVTGTTTISFASLDASNLSYVLFAYASLSGLNGVGYHVSSVFSEKSVVPLVGNFSQSSVLLAHSYDINGYYTGNDDFPINYNSTMIILTEDNTFRDLSLNITGTLRNDNGTVYPYGSITIPTCNQGIVVTVYNSSATDSGFVIMPWGFGLLGESLTFGGNPSNAEWVATDLRQVLVGDIAYQVKICVWSYKGISVTEY